MTTYYTPKKFGAKIRPSSQSALVTYEHRQYWLVYCSKKLLELRQREVDQERQKLQWEQRGGFGGNNNGGFNQNNGMGGGGPSPGDGLVQMDADNGGGGSGFNMFESAFCLFSFFIFINSLVVVVVVIYDEKNYRLT